ncbi:predicted protein [Nematostella vectensis]|uniref:SRCR domain-containing protein n=1 Tax=Nematostella vectensis TaxID=45351 RepID=A7RS16_NEMVE|nr:predicted protein [Nematostella vectensis]|eukprot:XP_001637788.1 predicted protein [Nematostella vectensis]
MAWSLLLLLLKVLLIQGVVSLSCEFNKDFCGWQHPVNATDKWILISEQHGNYTTFFRNGQLIYPNFTGHGDLVLSYYLFSNSYEKNEELRVKVGNATLLSVFDESIYWPLSWNSSRLRVDADREKVIIEGIIRNNAVSRIVIDSIKFYEKNGNYTTFLRNGKLIYPNFTGHGDLVLSYYLFSNSYEKNEELRVKVGNATLLSVFDESIYWPLSWNSSRLRVDADREKVIIEGIIRNNAVSRIVIDSIKFYEKNETPFQFELGANISPETIKVFSHNFSLATIRLTEGYTHMDGDVEIQVDGRWGKICIGGGRIQEKLVAIVTCRYLGYEGDAYLITSPWQRIPRDAWMDLRSCDGTEASVTECVGTFDRYICPYHRKLAVNCNKAPCPGNCSCSGEAVNEIRCRKQDILPQELILIPYYTEKVHIHGVDWSMLKRIMENPANNKKRLKIRLLKHGKCDRASKYQGKCGSSGKFLFLSPQSSSGKTLSKFASLFTFMKKGVFRCWYYWNSKGDFHLTLCINIFVFALEQGRVAVKHRGRRLSGKRIWVSKTATGGGGEVEDGDFWEKGYR